MTEQQNLLTPNFQNQQPNLPNATASLVLGIISIVGAFCYGVVGIICGIVGLVLANKDKKLYEENPGVYSASSYSTTNSGRVCSIIGLAVGVVILIIMVIYLAFFGSLIMNAARHAQ